MILQGLSKCVGLEKTSCSHTLVFLLGAVQSRNTFGSKGGEYFVQPKHLWLLPQILLCPFDQKEPVDKNAKTGITEYVLDTSLA